MGLIMPKVSVVIPTYNSAKYLPETINSILSQDYDDFEIIVVDDHSTDDTKKVIKEFNCNKIRYIFLEKNHGGPSKPRNVGLKAAQGKYIAFCDSDDLFLQGRISSAVQFLDDNQDLGMTFTDEEKFSEATGKDLGNFLEGYDSFHALPKKKIAENYFIIDPKHAYSCLFYENYIMPSGVTVPASVFKAVGYFDETITNGDDKDMWFRITKNFPIGFIDQISFKYRKRLNSISARGQQLAINRLKVFRKQLNNGIPQSLQKRCHEMIATNIYEIGYHYQIQGDMKNARKYYFQSLIVFLNWPALRGIFISIFGRKIYFGLKK